MLQQLSLVLLVSLLSFHTADDNFIDWSASRELTWNDFKGSPNPKSSDAALTSSTINAEFSYDKNGLNYSISCRFDKSKSWVRVKNNYILNHEQGHFDLTEGYARELNKELQEYKFRKQSASGDLNKIYGRVMQKLIDAQNEYDKQTDHSLDTAKQSAWDVKIKSMLKEFEDFKDYR